MKKSIAAAVLVSLFAISASAYPSPDTTVTTLIGSVADFFFAPNSSGKPVELLPAVVEPQAVVLSWNTFGNLGTETSEPGNANDPNIAAANLTLGAGVTAAANGNRFGGSNWFDTGDTAAGSTLAESVAGNDYIEVIVTPNVGFSFTPTSLDFRWDRSGTGPDDVTLRSSADGFTADLGTVTGIVAGAFALNTITISGLNSLTTATTFRLYGHGGTAAAGTGGYDTNANAVNVTLNGTVSSIGGAPEMNVQGNSTNIVNGDPSPDLADHTDFGPRAVGTGPASRTFTIQNTGTAALNLTNTPRVQIGGTNPLNFVVTTDASASVATASSTTFTIEFTPNSEGAFSATVSIANDDSDENPYTFAIQGNGVAAKYRSATTGNWGDASTWEVSTDGGTNWIPATAFPESGDDTIEVRNGHTVTVTGASSPTVDQLTVDSGGTLDVLSGQMTVNDGAGNDLVNNGTLTVTFGELSIHGQLMNNSSVSIINIVGLVQNGTAHGSGSWTWGSSAQLHFENDVSLYEIDSLDAIWPAVNGPQDIRVIGEGGLAMNVARTITTIQIEDDVFGANNLTINGLASIQLGGSVTGSPTYGPTSSLAYNIGDIYGRGDEWLPGATSGPGVPNNVGVGGLTTLVLPNGTTNQEFLMTGDLFIDPDATLSMGAMTVPLRVKGDVTISSGTLELSTADLGDLYVGGDWNNSGTLQNNGRLVAFDGIGTQAINGTTDFGHLAITTTSARTVTFEAGATNAVHGSLTFTGTAGNLLTLRSSFAGNQWNFSQGTPNQDVNFVDVQDSNASFGLTVISTNSVDSGNNINWNFGVGPVTRVVDTTSDNIALNQCVTGTPNDCSLRGAISIANDGDTINFDTGIFSLTGGAPQTITLGNEIAVTDDITITGPGADKLTIDGGAGSNRVFYIDGAGLNVTISGVSITGGNGTGAQNNGIGGAIYARCQLTLDRVHIFQNTTTSGGGVAFIDGGPYEIRNSTVNNNSVSLNGGGIDKEGTGNLTVINSTISGNAATPPNGFGGGIFSGGSGNLTVRTSTITGNSGSNGGGIGTLGGNLSFGSTIVAGNSVLVPANGPEIDIVIPASATSQGFNLFGDSAGDAANTGAPITYQGTDILDTPPLLGPLQNNGGTMPTHRPQTGSPVHDKGNDPDNIPFDQRGLQRTVNWPNVADAAGGDGTDIGSVELVAPTSALADISGRILTANGRGIANVMVTVENDRGELLQTTLSSSFGYYTIRGLPVGEPYVISVRSKRFIFGISSRIIMVNNDLEGINFIADP